MKAQFTLPTIIDVEASGFGVGSYPIEIGVVSGDGEAYCALIKPAASWQHWDTEAEALHHIRREFLFEYGRDIQTVAAELNEFLANQTVYSDAWANDLSWVGLLFDVAEIQQQFRLESLHVLLQEEQKLLWDRAKLQVMTELELNRHRASNDARIIQQTFLQTLQTL